MKKIIFILSILISLTSFSQSKYASTQLTLDGQFWGADTVKCVVLAFDQDASSWEYVDTYFFADEYSFEFYEKGSFYSITFFDEIDREKNIMVLVSNRGKFRIDLDFREDTPAEMLMFGKVNTINEYVVALLK